MKEFADAKVMLPPGEEIGPCRYPNRMLKPTQMAPDFEAEAYYRGERKIIRLSSYRNQWVVLFFYASDFTFV